VKQMLIAYQLNTTLHHASSNLLDQAVMDFGAKLAASTKHRWVEHLSTQDVDEIADALFQRASDRFLDRALARRFETISGRALVNALARAERLGYDTRDIVEKDANQAEHVIPSVHPPVPGNYTQHPQTIAHHPQHAPPPRYPQTFTPVHYQAPARTPPIPIMHPTPGQRLDAQPLGIQFCDYCGRPCSGPQALDNVRAVEITLGREVEN
jgi:hypothetical protein